MVLSMTRHLSEASAAPSEDRSTPDDRLSSEESKTLHGIVHELGLERAAKKLDLSAQTVTRALAGLSQRRATVFALRVKLGEYA